MRDIWNISKHFWRIGEKITTKLGAIISAPKRVLFEDYKKVKDVTDNSIEEFMDRCGEEELQIL